MSPIYLCVSIDCECDKGPKWRSQRPLGFRGISEGIGRRLHPLFRAYGAKPTYLLSPEVLRDQPSVTLLRSLAGCELGTHLHGEYADPGAHEPKATTAFQCHYPPEIERLKLSSLTESFVAAFGRRPTAFRAGRFGVGSETLGFLSRLGYSVDSSVTPGIDWSASGAPGLSFRGAPVQPYRPEVRAPQTLGTAPILEVPVTIRPRKLARVPVLGRWIGPRWLRPTWGSASRLLGLMSEEITAARALRPQRPVVLNAMFHNVEVIPGASPYARNEAGTAAILGRLAALLDHARQRGIAVIGLSDVPAVLGEAAGWPAADAIGPGSVSPGSAFTSQPPR